MITEKNNNCGRCLSYSKNKYDKKIYDECSERINEMYGKILGEMDNGKFKEYLTKTMFVKTTMRYLCNYDKFDFSFVSQCLENLKK